MNLSRKWLNEFVKVTASDKEFAEAMTLSGSKVEVTVDTGAEITNVVVGKVLTMKRHENSDHMWVCMVDVGEGEPTQIVTGAQNVKEGDPIHCRVGGHSQCFDAGGVFGDRKMELYRSARQSVDCSCVGPQFFVDGHYGAEGLG